MSGCGQWGGEAARGKFRGSSSTHTTRQGTDPPPPPPCLPIKPIALTLHAASDCFQEVSDVHVCSSLKCLSRSLNRYSQASEQLCTCS